MPPPGTEIAMTDPRFNMAAAMDQAAAPPGGVACWRRGVALCLRAPAALFILALLAQYAALIPDLAGMIAPDGAAGSGLVLALAAAYLQAFFYGALILRLDRAAGGARRPRPGFGATVNLAVAAIGYQVAVGIGVLLFILPGFFVSIAWLLFAFPIVLDGAGPVAGLAASQRWVVPRFLRVSAAVSVAFVLYSLYLVATWVPDFAGVAWRPLADAIVAARHGAAPPIETALRLRALVTPGAVAAPWWYFGLNPFLGGIVMPPVMGTLYWIYRGLGKVCQAGISRG